MFFMHISQNINVSIQQFNHYVLMTSLTAILTSAQKNFCAVRRRYLLSCITWRWKKPVEWMAFLHICSRLLLLVLLLASLSSSTFQLGWVRRTPDLWKDVRVTSIPEEILPTLGTTGQSLFCLSWASSLSTMCMLLLLAILTVLVPFRTVSGALLLEDRQLVLL